MRYLVLAALLAATPAIAAEPEYEIAFYYQPDSTGKNTLNKSIQLEDGELQIEESRNDGNNRFVERDATAEEADRIKTFVMQRIRDFEFVATDDLDAPKVEIRIEVNGNTREIEVEEIYAAGSVPALYLDIQKEFFNSAFE